MVSTRGKKKTARSNKTSLAKGQDVEVLNLDAQLVDKVEIPVEEAGAEGYEGMPVEEESEKVRKIDNNDENKLLSEMNGDNKAETEQNTSEDDEMDDQEDLMWDDEDEFSEEYNEDNVADEDEVSEEEAIKDDDDDEDEASMEEGSEEEDDDEDEIDREEATEVAKGDGEEAKAKEDGKKAKEDGRKVKENNTEKFEAGLKNDKNSNERSKKKKVRGEKSMKVDSKDKPELSRKRNVKNRVECMGMVFMCSSKTKNDCYQYRVLGLPESKKDLVEKIYTGMRLFLYDVDLKLMYGIYKAAGPGGYNIEPKAFKSQFPSQVRFKVLDECMPLPEEKFKKIIKDNYYTNTKFDCLLKSEQVRKLCRLFLDSSKGHHPKKLGKGPRKAEKLQPVRGKRSRRPLVVDERHAPLRGLEPPRYRERPRKRPRKVSISPPRRAPPPPLPPYDYERPSDIDAYQRDRYLESRNPYENRREAPLVIRRDPYPERDYPPPYVERRDPYFSRVRDRERDRDREPYIGGRASYLDRRDPYRDVRDPDTGIRDSYRDVQDPDMGIRDSYRDRRDSSYLDRRDPYRDGAMRSEIYDTSYGRPDPISGQGGELYRDSSFRRDDVLERRDVYPFDLQTRPVRHEIGGGHDSYVASRQRPSLSYADPIYSAEYSSRAGLPREYHI